MTVIYEWDVETVTIVASDDYDAEEVLDHAHQRNYRECLRYVSANAAPDGCRFDVVLVRDDDDRRAWAYVEDGKLPEFFHDADGHNCAKVPARFHKEVIR